MVDDLISVKVDTAEFEAGIADASAELQELAYKRMVAATEYLREQAVIEAPSDTGQLRASMFCRTDRTADEIRGVVGNLAEYAPYVHQGTGIYAVGGMGRTTPWMVQTIYKGHPVAFWTHGIRPQPFLKNALEKNLGEIKKILGVEE